MNIARYNAGGSQWNSINGTTMQASPNIPGWKQIAGYWLDWDSADPSSKSWNWTADSNQRTMLLKAQTRGANLFELFSNSPMWWMCLNHNPSGADDGSKDNLQSWNYDQHAVYLATIAAYAVQNWGISFHSIEAFNEPSSSWWTSTGTQEGCHFDASTQAQVIGNLRKEMTAQGLKSSLSASDETSYDLALSTWNSFSSTTQSQVDQVNVHGYEYAGGRRDLLYSAVSGAGKRLWNSEYGESDASGMSLASNLNLDFVWLHPTAWNYWQPLDGGGWGLIDSNVGPGGYIGNPNPKYFVVAQYSRHIRPGMTIIGGGEGNTIAAYDTSAKKLVIVTTNYGTAQTITYDLSKFNVTGPITRWTTNTGSGDKYVQHNDVTLNGKSFASAFQVNTVQTFEVQNAVPL